MKVSKRFRWTISFSILSIFLLVFLGRVGVVRAVFDESYDAMVLYRILTETLPSTPAGQYYLDLLLKKHGSEIIQIVEAHPERMEMFIHTFHQFVPEFEAFLNGEGDTAYISTNHVASLDAELDWFISMGSPALKKDIQKERQRLLMDKFVGMTMNEAWEYINSKWTPDMVVQPAATLVPVTPTPVAQVLEQSVTKFGCSNLVKDHYIVPDSDGQWAYYVQDGIYFEYPASYHICLGVNSFGSSILFTASQNFANWNDPSSVMVEIRTLPVDREDELTPSAWFSTAPRNVVWQRTLPGSEFEGTEYVLVAPISENDVICTLGALLYNQENELGLHIQVHGIRPSTNDFSVLSQEYEYFQHMVENVRMHIP